MYDTSYKFESACWKLIQSPLDFFSRRQIHHTNFEKIKPLCNLPNYTYRHWQGDWVITQTYSLAKLQVQS